MSTQQVTGLTRDGELRELIVRGQEMGFLGMEEVAEVLDGLGLDADAAEEVYQHLEEAGVELLEQSEAGARAATLSEEVERGGPSRPSSRRPTRSSCSSRTSAGCRS
jgi:RNA polymerase primary sigma factor